VSPGSLACEAIGDRPVSDDVFTIRNVGGGILDYSITDDADWLEVSPTGGASTSEADTVHVIYHNAGLTAGAHHATIKVADPAAGNSPQTLAVTLTVRIPGDFDHDLDVDQQDFGQFQLCLTSTGVDQDNPACAPARLDADADVDQNDFQLFEQCMTGANTPGTASCASTP
jgi:hypothetical protein